MHIPLASNGLHEKDIHLAVQTLKSGNLTMGEQVRIFEERMANYLNVSNIVMVNSDSWANLAIIESLLRPAKGPFRFQKRAQPNFFRFRIDHVVIVS
jgi:dTDP-4-amino-4,6-dideoxygalactose transaminase